MFNGRRNALLPAWFWLTVVNVFRYTAIRQNQLLHIRLGDINLEEKWIDLNIEERKTIASIGFRLSRRCIRRWRNW
jgi:hypothetical protein